MAVKFSKITIFLALFIIISASFMRQVVDFIQRYTGERIFMGLLGMVVVSACVSFVIFMAGKKRSLIEFSALVLSVAIGLFFVWRIKYPIEKIHLLEYGALGYLASKDLSKINKEPANIILAGIFCAIVGITDELFQKILPGRFYDIRDINVNILSSSWGMILYILS